VKILHVTPYFAWAHGGPPQSILGLSQELVRRGHSVTIYTTDTGMFHRLRDNEKITVPSDLVGSLHIQYFGCLNNWLADKVLLHFSHQMRLTFKRTLGDFDIVHLNDLRNMPNQYAWKYAREYNTPYVLQPRGAIAYHHYESPFRRISKKAFDMAITNKLAEHAAKLIALSNAENEQLIDFGIRQDKIEIIPNGIDVAEYDNLPARGEFREKYQISRAEYVVLYLGRLHKRKGIDRLIDSFVEVKEELEDTKLVIAGPDYGSLFALKKQAHDYGLSEDILFPGSLYDKAKLSAFVDANVSVLPATNEAFGRTILESILCGTPVVASREGGCGELLQKMGCARSAANSEMQTLSDSIKYILRHQGEGEELVKIGQRYILENLTWSTIAERVERIYEACL
jgi:glycosyltransferase involved in cell wall biosynthesis